MRYIVQNNAGPASCIQLQYSKTKAQSINCLLTLRKQIHGIFTCFRTVFEAVTILTHISRCVTTPLSRIHLTEILTLLVNTVVIVTALRICGTVTWCTCLTDLETGMYCTVVYSTVRARLPAHPCIISKSTRCEWLNTYPMRWFHHYSFVKS